MAAAGQVHETRATMRLKGSTEPGRWRWVGDAEEEAVIATRQLLLPYTLALREKEAAMKREEAALKREETALREKGVLEEERKKFTAVMSQLGEEGDTLRKKLRHTDGAGERLQGANRRVKNARLRCFGALSQYFPTKSCCCQLRHESLTLQNPACDSLRSS